MNRQAWMTKALTQWLTARGGWGMLYGFCLLMLLFLAAPIAIVIIVSFSDAPFVYFPPPGFSIRWYTALLDYGGFIDSFLLSVRLALLVTVLSVTLGTTAAMGLTRDRFPGRDLLNTFLMSPLIFPSIITGIALLQFFSMLGISSAFFALTIGHTIITLPYVVRNVIASLQSVRGNFEEAARVLGASTWQAFIRVTLPLIKPGLMAGGIFAFIISYQILVIHVCLDCVWPPVERGMTCNYFRPRLQL